MKLSQRICGALVVILLPALYGLGCAAPVESGDDAGAEEEVVTIGDGRVSEATEELVGTCHGNVTCPDPKSCGSWSTYTVCGTACLYARTCSCPPLAQDPECVPDGTKGLVDHSQAFRSCTLQNNTTCTEYKEVVGFVHACGC